MDGFNHVEVLNYSGNIEGFEALIAGLIGIILVFSVILFIVYAIAYMGIFKKAGEAGWKAFIPILSDHVIYKIGWSAKWFWIAIVLIVIDMIMWMSFNPILMALSWIFTIAVIVISIMFAVKLSQSFGKSGLFAVGLIFLGPIFYYILAFGSAEYIEKENLIK